MNAHEDLKELKKFKTYLQTSIKKIEDSFPRADELFSISDYYLGILNDLEAEIEALHSTIKENSNTLFN